MATYYIDAVNGSDGNNGTAAGAAFQSIAKMSTIKLKAGDTVLLARGSSFADMLTINGSGTLDKPITIGAYGQGSDPAFVGKQGIIGTKTANIVIKDLTFSTGFNAIYAGQAENWVIDNVKLVNAGAATGTGSISMKNSTNVTISNSTFDNVHNDAIYVREMTGLTIVNNVMTNLKGPSADGIQVTGGTNIRVEGNRIDLSNSADSTKGGVIMNKVTGVVASGNQITGGSFGIAINGWDIAITGNKISDQNKYSWSAGIMASAGMDMGNYKISGNEVSGSNFGVAITGLARDGAVTRENVDISGNSFVGIVTAALKVDKQTSGSFHDNIIIDSTETLIRGGGLKGALSLTGNLNTTAAKAADALKAQAAVTATTQAEATAKAQAEAAQALAVAKAQAEAAAIAAKAQAEAIAKAEAEAAKAHMESASENLNKIQKVGINADRYAMDVSGGHVLGNILDNDANAQGATLALRAVEGARIGTKGLDVKGDYGTLHIEQNGNFTYSLDAGALSKLKGIAAPVDRFQYKAADGGTILTSSVSIDLTSYISNQAPTGAAAKAAQLAALKAGKPAEKAKAVDDFYKIGGDDLTVSGNVSTNDATADGGTLSLRTVGNATLAGGAVDLAGKYGTLHIDATGAFTYTLHGDATARMLDDSKTSDSFVYKAALGESYDQGALVIDLSAHLHTGDTILL